MKVRYSRSRMAAMVVAAFATLATASFAQEKILVGQSAPLSGPAADIGRDIRDGALAYFAKVNQAGGVNGRKVEMITLDDVNDRKRAAANAKTLIEERKVAVLFGFASATLSMDAIPLAEAHNMALFAPFSGSLAIRDKKPVFTVRASYADEISSIVAHWSVFGATKMAVLHYDDEVGKVNYTTVADLLKASGQTPHRVSLKRGAKVDPKVFEDLFKFAPQVIIATTQFPPVLELIDAMAVANKSFPVSALSFVNPDELAEAKAAKGTNVTQVVPNPRGLTVPVVRECSEAMKAAKIELNYTTLESCIAAKVLVEGMKKAKGAAPKDIVAGLHKVGRYDTGGFVVSLSPESQHGSTWTDLSILSRGGTYRH
jgi:branched-chain amino acid transport system substrate-binding protein